MPIISAAGEVKDLAQRHWRAEGRIAAMSPGPSCVTPLDQDSLWDALGCGDAQLVLALLRNATGSSSSGTSADAIEKGRQAFVAPALSEWEMVIGRGVTALHVAGSWCLEARHTGRASELAAWSEVVWQMATRPDVRTGRRAILTTRLQCCGSAKGRAWVAGGAGQTVSSYLSGQDALLAEMLDQLMEPGGSDAEVDEWGKGKGKGKGDSDDEGNGKGRFKGNFPDGKGKGRKGKDDSDDEVKGKGHFKGDSKGRDIFFCRLCRSTDCLCGNSRHRHGTGDSDDKGKGKGHFKGDSDDKGKGKGHFKGDSPDGKGNGHRPGRGGR